MTHLFQRTRRLGAMALIAAAISCSGDTVVSSPITDGTTLFWSITLDQHALNLSTVAPYDSARVVATPRNSAGDPLPGAGPVRYSSGDLERLQVNDDGVLHAIGSGTGIPIIASLTVGNITHVDTALVSIVEDSVPVAPSSFSIQPVPPDSAIWDAGAMRNFSIFDPTKPIVPHDDAGTPISGLSIFFSSSDTSVATIDRSSGVLSGVRPGHVTIIASTTAYGVEHADTLPFTITMPSLMLMGIAPPSETAQNFVVFPNPVTVAAGASVLFFDESRSQIDITFEDPTNVAEDQQFCFCGGGNIELFGGDTLDFNNDIRARSFPVAGTYVFHASHDATGTIIVEAPPASARRVHDPLVASRHE